MIIQRGGVAPYEDPGPHHGFVGRRRVRQVVQANGIGFNHDGVIEVAEGEGIAGGNSFKKQMTADTVPWSMRLRFSGGHGVAQDDDRRTAVNKALPRNGE